MKGLRMATVVVVCLIIFSGCNGIQETCERTAGKHVEQFETAIQKGDTYAIYNMFADSVKGKDVTCEDVEKLLDFIGDDKESFKYRKIYSESKSIHLGKTIHSYGNHCHITINGVPYRIDINACIRDDNNKGNEGLTSIVLFPRDADVCVVYFEEDVKNVRGIYIE